MNMTTMAALDAQVTRLFASGLEVTLLAELNIKLHLLRPPQSQLQFDTAQIEAIWSDMPYWAFAWSSGRALAKFILDHPHLVAGKRIADFGAGSAVVAIAALQAGASSALAVDIDEQALRAAQCNASLNGLTIEVAKALPNEQDVDLIVVGDVLYDPRNHGLAAVLFKRHNEVIWAESRAQTKLSHLLPKAQYHAETYPNIGGFDEHQDIHIYHHMG